MFLSTCGNSVRRHAAWVAIAALTTVPAVPPVHAAAPGGGGQYSLKTPKANAAVLAPLADSLFAFDEYARTHAGKAPADGGKRLDELARLAPQAKAEIRRFVDGLRRANETDAFDKYVYEMANSSGRPTLANEIRSAGGAVRVLSTADTFIDSLIAERRKALASPADLDRVLEAFGVTVTLSAGVLSTACGFFWFTISLGYAEAHAYRSCYY
ncbi:MAG: hypothetical protein ACHQO8_05920 [Vicinamibacterales bacterium]